MKKIFTLLVLSIALNTYAQTLKSPSEFLGYELGTEFSRHHEVVGYYKYLALVAPENVKLITYGKTNERRLLQLAYVSSAENLANLEEIRKEHLKNTTGTGTNDKAIVWLSYNVHGNESVSTEASMKTIYSLLTDKKEYLKNTIVIIDPCINPDGRDRYVNWYNQNKNTPNQVDPNSVEHHEGWLSGRSNHYMFDLNRDWAWLTQVESQQRLKIFNQWLPHVHVDFHEQGVDNPYYFAPAAEPYHEVITDFQREFQETIGRNHAKYFDAKGWFYFTKEVFDLLYPSYGDTYPMYNGSIGMTYEQGGSGRAGLGIITKNGDTLTLQERIDHHFTTGLSTVEVAARNTQRLNSEFKKFYQQKNFTYKDYVLNGDVDKIRALSSLLNKHEIAYHQGTNSTVKGFGYQTNRQTSLKSNENSLVVSTNQPKGTMVKVLFEPAAKLSDSLTYDITAWSLPYAYGLDAVASTNTVSKQNFMDQPITTKVTSNAYAHVTDWNSMYDARFLAELLQKGIKIRAAHHSFTLNGKSFERGSLIITKTDNEQVADFETTLQEVATKHYKSLEAVNTGFVDGGKDFGSSAVRMIKKPKVAVFNGKPSSTLQFGEVWHFFEQQLNYPVTILNEAYFKNIDLDAYDVLILPNGRYNSYLDETTMAELKDWVKAGGKLIAMGGALKSLTGSNGFGLKIKELEKETEATSPTPSHAIERERMKNAITGAIFKTRVDNSNPLAYGYGNSYFTLKLGTDSYDYLKQGNAVYLEKDATPVSGFAGTNAQKKLGNTLVFGNQNYGRGQVIYMVDNPLFRGFWENGKLFFANALFMVD
ncbi:M14 family metallopeptidase [Flavobacterium sp. ASW18X]|uniref:M14 family metallopeptidase n=1 Tax=Flavobacterium sp. ASW18X TaxID=2572595 RepID=UPI0010AEA731|nr:M14 family metallopeptidase [Flavobacterium sp. ASW18X]TKD62383.1 zinc carboxypeptidase [Flavobacterium sp. ASW18X]